MKVFFIVALAFSTAVLRAQDPLRMRYGVYGGINVNNESAAFSALAGVPSCCPQYSSGSGTGMNAGALVEFPVNRSAVFGIRAGVHSLSGQLKEPEGSIFIVNNVPTAGVITHNIDAGIMTVGMEAIMSYRVFDKLLIDVGIRGGVMTTKTYSQWEEAGVGTFVDSNGNDTHSRIRNSHSGDIPQAANMQWAFIAGLGYEVPLNRAGTMIACPEILYQPALTSIASGLGWKVNSLVVGVALKFSPIPRGVAGDDPSMPRGGK